MANKPNRRSLELFVEKATRVLGSSYVRQLRQSQLGILGRLGPTGEEFVFVGPDVESTEALVLNIRFFCQDNEPSSIRNVAASLESPAFGPELGSAFEGARARLNDYLDADSGFGHEAFQTRRDIFGAFIYGRYAHSTRSRTLEKLDSDFAMASLSAYFCDILEIFCLALEQMMPIVERALAELSPPEEIGRD